MARLAIGVKTIPRKDLELSQIIESLVIEFRKSPGCLSYSFKRDKSSEFHLDSEWENMVQLEEHFRSKLFSVMLGAFHTLCEKPEVKITDGRSSYGMEVIKVARGVKTMI